MLATSFAWIPTKGYTTKAGATQQFPVIVGEFGSALVDAPEQMFLRDFALFANNLGGAAQPKHANLTSWTWCVSAPSPGPPVACALQQSMLSGFGRRALGRFCPLPGLCGVCSAAGLTSLGLETERRACPHERMQPAQAACALTEVRATDALDSPAAT